MTTATIEKPTETPSVRVGIIGAGGRGIGCFGKLLKEHEGVNLAALADTNMQRLEGAQQTLESDAELYTDVEAMLRESKLDGVVITTPDFTHAETVIAALYAGVKHVLVDKPLATTTDGCVNVVKAMEETGGKVAIGFNLRHAPLLARIKEIIANGEIGDLMLAENREFYDGGRTYMARWNRKYAWSGGLWIHKGSHDFDIFNWWNEGGVPQTVFASGGLNALRPDKIPFEVEDGKPVGPTCSECAYYDICPDHNDAGKSNMFNEKTANADGYHKDLCIYTSDKDVHDNGIAIVQYDNNVRVSHLECFVTNVTDRSYTIVGDRATLEAHLHDPTEIHFRPRWGEEKIIDVPQPRDGGHGGADPSLVDDLVHAMRGESVKLSGIKDGIRAVAVGQAAEISWRENRAVNISELVDLYDPRFND